MMERGILLFIVFSLLDVAYAAVAPLTVTPLNGPAGIPVGQRFGGCCNAAYVNDVVKLGNTMVVATEADIKSFQNSQAIGLQISDDNGLTWRTVTTLQGNPPDVYGFTKLAVAGERIYALTNTRHKPERDSVFYSDDYGKTWLPVDPGDTLFSALPEPALSGADGQPFHGILVDNNYLYVTYFDFCSGSMYCAEGGTTNINKVFRIPHSLQSVDVFSPVAVGSLVKMADGGWIGAQVSSGNLYWMDENFSNAALRLEPASVIYSIATEGDYVVAASNYIYESYDGGYSFLKRYPQFCELVVFNHVAIMNGQLFVSSPCGVAYKPIMAAAGYRKLLPLDFNFRFDQSLKPDPRDNRLYFTNSRLHWHDFNTKQGTTITPVSALAHITAIQAVGADLYVGTMASGIWRYRAGSWQPVQNGLAIQNNDRVPGGFSNTIYDMDLVRLPDGKTVVCAGTTLGLYCLNSATDYWVDVSSAQLVALQGDEAGANYQLMVYSPVLAFKQVSPQRVLLSFNHVSIRNTDIWELALDTSQIAQLLAVAPVEIASIPAEVNFGFSPAYAIQKTRLLSLNNSLFKSEGHLSSWGVYADPPTYITRSGLTEIPDISNINAGYFYNYAAKNLSRDFINTNVQDMVIYKNKLVAAVFNAGVYFETDAGFIPRNRLLSNLKVRALAVFNGVLYVGTEKGLFLWDDVLMQWVNLADTQHLIVTELAAWGRNLAIGTARDGVVLLQSPHNKKRKSILTLLMLFNRNAPPTEP